MALSQLESGSSVNLTSHMMESLLFCMAVYEKTSEAAVDFLCGRLGKVEPLIFYGFEEAGEMQQAILAARSLRTGRIVVACRGTSGFRDVVQDLKYLQSRLSFIKGAAAHWGFAERAESIPTDFLLKLLEAGEEVILAGHSLGGAVASLLTLRILESSRGKFDEQVSCVTFGCPLFANCQLADWINSNYKDIFTHIVSRRDVVPKILPLVSTFQKLVYANEDHLEGLLVLRKVLELIPGIPLAGLLSSVERRVPGLLKYLFRSVIKLAMPAGRTGMIGSYAFAGHVVMLDTGVAATQPLRLASPVDMNVWHSQLGFAFGSAFDGRMIAEHMLPQYRDGILRAVPVDEISGSLSSVATLTQTQIPADLAPNFSSGKLSMLGKSFDGIEISSTVKTTGNMTRQKSLIVKFTPEEPEDQVEIEIQCDSEGAGSPSVLVRRGSSPRRRVDLGTGQWSPTTASSIQKLLTGGASSCESLARTRSEFHPSLTRSSSSFKSVKLERSMTVSSWCSSDGRSDHSHHSTGSRIPWTPLKRTGSLARSKEVVLRCRACANLKAYIKITSCCCSHESPRKGVGFRWFLGTVGKVARHLRILDSLCYMTFIRIVMSNLVG